MLGDQVQSPFDKRVALGNKFISVILRVPAKQAKRNNFRVTEGIPLPSETACYIDQLIRDYVHPLMKARGFRRKGRTWNRAGAGLIQVANLQGSAYNNGGRGRVYINLGIFVPGMGDEPAAGDARPFVVEPLCQLRLRVGDLMPVNKHFWDFDVSDGLGELGISVTEALLSYGLPFFDQSRSVEDLDHLLDQRELRFHFHAALKVQQGDKEAARHILLGASQTNAEYQRAAIWTANRLGIDLGLGEVDTGL